MTHITVFGASGYAGSHIIEAAAVRGFEVTAVSRGEVAEQIAGVDYVRGSLLSAEDRAKALHGTDAVVVAVSARGDMLGQVRDAIAALAGEAAASGVRLGVIGGAGSLRVAEGGARIVDSGFPEEFKPEALEMADVLDDLRGSHEGLDWFFVSPAGDFGSFNPGEFRGEYRVGGDVLLVDEQGKSDISGADFGVAIVDEIEQPQHRRKRFTVAY
ncbi:MAG: NAD(P)H-binding protein [Leucobacter sp.]|nr:NAD(P)H-binding protein [Leucobacter sp.]